jgi:hypothetical protein
MFHQAQAFHGSCTDNRRVFVAESATGAAFLNDCALTLAHQGASAASVSAAWCGQSQTDGSNYPVIVSSTQLFHEAKPLG